MLLKIFPHLFLAQSDCYFDFLIILRVGYSRLIKGWDCLRNQAVCRKHGAHTLCCTGICFLNLHTLRLLNVFPLTCISPAIRRGDSYLGNVGCACDATELSYRGRMSPAFHVT